MAKQRPLFVVVNSSYWCVFAERARMTNAACVAETPSVPDALPVEMPVASSLRRFPRFLCMETTRNPAVRVQELTRGMYSVRCPLPFVVTKC